MITELSTTRKLFAEYDSLYNSYDTNKTKIIAHLKVGNLIHDIHELKKDNTKHLGVYVVAGTPVKEIYEILELANASSHGQPVKFIVTENLKSMDSTESFNMSDPNDVLKYLEIYGAHMIKKACAELKDYIVKQQTKLEASSEIMYTYTGVPMHLDSVKIPGLDIRNYTHLPFTDLLSIAHTGKSLTTNKAYKYMKDLVSAMDFQPTKLLMAKLFIHEIFFNDKDKRNNQRNIDKIFNLIGVPKDLSFMSNTEAFRINMIKSVAPDLSISSLEFWLMYEDMRKTELAKKKKKGKPSESIQVDPALFN